MGKKAIFNAFISYLKKGIQCRTTGSTEMNSSSSRSHAIFSIILKQHINDEALVENDRMLNLENVVMPTNKHLVSKFHFVDLAGSERVKKKKVYCILNEKCLLNNKKKQCLVEKNKCFR